MKIEIFTNKLNVSIALVSVLATSAVFAPKISYACTPNAGWVTVASAVTSPTSGVPQPNLQEECSFGSRLIRNFSNIHGAGRQGVTMEFNHTGWTEGSIFDLTADGSDSTGIGSFDCLEQFQARSYYQWNSSLNKYQNLNQTSVYSGDHHTETPSYNLCP